MINAYRLHLPKLCGADPVRLLRYSSLVIPGGDYTGVPKSLRLTAPRSGGGLRPNKGKNSGRVVRRRKTNVARDMVYRFVEVYRLVITPYGVLWPK